MSLRITVVGGGLVGRHLAVRLSERGDDVRLIERDEDTARAMGASDAAAIVGDGTDTETLAAADTAGADVFVAATADRSSQQPSPSS